jgi:pimeloyl-ACP methyl ester carboxylesterase
MAYTDRGNGLPIVFIHGYPLNRYLWEPQTEALSDTMRVLAPDLRGHGESQAVPGPYSMGMFANDLNAFLDALQINQPVVVCGLSMGGYVTFEFHRKYAHRMAGLILTATRATADSPEGRAARDQAAQTAQQQGIPAIIDGMLAKLVSPTTYQERPELLKRIRQIMLKTSLDGVLGALMGMKTRPDSTATLRQIELPALIIHGADDQIVPLKEAQAMQAAIPDARLEVIPKAGHLLNLEQPDLFNPIVREFITAIK